MNATKSKLIKYLSFFALPATILALMVGAHTAFGNNSITAAQCQQNWNQAPARAWCWFEDAQVTSDNKCKLTLGCGTGSDRPTVNYTGTLNNVRQLRWCGGGNNGWLVVGNC